MGYHYTLTASLEAGKVGARSSLQRGATPVRPRGLGSSFAPG